MAQSLETLRGNNITSIFGRRIGLQQDETLVVKALKNAIQDLSTASSGTAVNAYGVTQVTATGSTQGPVQYLLDAPIPGVEKTLVLNSSSTGSFQFLTTAAGASVLTSSGGSTIGVINFVGPASFVKLIGLSTSRWLITAMSPYASTGLAQTVTFTTST